MRYPSYELHEFDHPQVRKLKHTAVRFIADGHLAQVEGRTDHFVGEKDRVEEILVTSAIFSLTTDLVIVYEEDQLVDGDHHVARCAFFHVDWFGDFELEDVLIEVFDRMQVQL